MFHQVIMLSCVLCVNMSTVITSLHVSPSHYMVMWILCQHFNCHHEASRFTMVIMLSNGFCVNMSTVIMRLHVLPSHYVVKWILCQHANCYH